jgi:hypothetical protein
MAVVGPSLQSLEIGDAGVIADHHFTVDGGVLGERVCGSDDQRVALAPVVTTPSKQTDAAIAPADDQPEAVVLDFVNPLRAGRRLVRDGRDAGVDEAHGSARWRHGT